MIKVLLPLILLSFFSLLSNAQSLTLTYDDQDVSNTEITVDGVLSSEVIKVGINITNSSDADINIRLKKQETDVVNGTVNSFCIGSCYMPETYESNEDFFLLAGETTERDEVYFEFFPEGHSGESTIYYEFWDNDNPDDKVSVTVNYSIVTTSVQSKFNETTLNAYPNPVSGSTVSINYNFAFAPNNAKLLVHNILGVEMKTINLQQSAGRLTLDIDDLPKGIYLYSLENNGRKISTKRFVKRD